MIAAWPRSSLVAAHARALLNLSDIETRIYLGEGGGLALRREQAEKRIDALTAQLREERVGVSRG